MWLLFIGFNTTFLPMHITGLLGMPRRVYTYQAGLGWDLFNLISTLGAFLIALSVLVFFYNAYHMFRSGEKAPAIVMGRLLLLHLYLRIEAPQWPPPDVNLPGPLIPSIGVALLLGAAAAHYLTVSGWARTKANLLRVCRNPCQADQTQRRNPALHDLPAKQNTRP